MLNEVGIDIVSIARIQRLIDSYGDTFLNRFLSQKEIDLARYKTQTIAGFWAAKEACSKALGVGISKDLTFHDIHIQKDSKQRPIISLSESRLLFFKISKLSLSISHDAGFAIAIVIAQ